MLPPPQICPQHAPVPHDHHQTQTQTALIREAALLRRFQHRHVLLLHTSFVVGRELWMVFPYMDLGSVRHIMRQAYPQVNKGWG